MKRYKQLTTRMPQLDGGAVDVENEMTERPDGQWVRWDDHKEESLRIAEIYEKRIRELKAKIGQECNCKEMSFNPDQYFWICPAHGYKRR